MTKGASTKGLRRCGSNSAADPRSIRGASMLCAWPVASGEWRIQSRNGTTTRYLRGLKLQRCAWAVCGGHLVVFALKGRKSKQRAEKIINQFGGIVLL